MKQGYVMLYRKMINWEWYTDVNTCKLFLHLILTANHESVYWKGIEIKRGETLTSIACLSKETGLSVQQVRTALSHLEKTDEITVGTTKFYTLIRLENYCFYQGFEQFERNTDNEAQTSLSQSCGKALTTNNNDIMK